MTLLHRVPGIGLLSLLMAMMLLSCETTKQTNSEFGSPNRIKGEAIAKSESRRIVHFTDTTTEYITPRSEMATAFIQQFGDGTVIDKVLVHKAPVGEGEPVSYYLVGMGVRDGRFRAMALPLTASGDDTYYLRPTAERYVITGTRCPMCYFNFENGRIVGTTCGEGMSGSNCDLKVEANNTLFSNTQ